MDAPAERSHNQAPAETLGNLLNTDDGHDIPPDTRVSQRVHSAHGAQKSRGPILAHSRCLFRFFGRRYTAGFLGTVLLWSTCRMAPRKPPLLYQNPADNIYSFLT